jgi:hypothetical protein
MGLVFLVKFMIPFQSIFSMGLQTWLLRYIEKASMALTPLIFKELFEQCPCY